MRVVMRAICFAFFASHASADSIGMPDQHMELVRDYTEALCPEAYFQAKEFYAFHPNEFKQARATGALWYPQPAYFEAWHNKALLYIGQLFINIPESALHYAAWVSVTSDLVEYPLKIGSLAFRVHSSGSQKDVTALLADISVKAEGLRVSLDLFECLYPTPDIIEDLLSRSHFAGLDVLPPIEDLECNKWHEFSRNVLHASETTDPYKLHSTFQILLADAITECREKG